MTIIKEIEKKEVDMGPCIRERETQPQKPDKSTFSYVMLKKFISSKIKDLCNHDEIILGAPSGIGKLHYSVDMS